MKKPKFNFGSLVKIKKSYTKYITNGVEMGQLVFTPTTISTYFEYTQYGTELIGASYKYDLRVVANSGKMAVLETFTNLNEECLRKLTRIEKLEFYIKDL